MEFGLLARIKGWAAAPAWFEPLLWTMCGLLGLLGVLAVLSPRGFAALARRSDTWIDVNRILAKLDTRIDIDQRVMPYSRALGMAVLCSVTVLVWLYFRYL